MQQRGCAVSSLPSTPRPSVRPSVFPAAAPWRRMRWHPPRFSSWPRLAAFSRWQSSAHSRG
eukprot:7698473-Lingulodinium_polyedra.AAC.1